MGIMLSRRSLMAAMTGSALMIVGGCGRATSVATPSDPTTPPSGDPADSAFDDQGALAQAAAMERRLITRYELAIRRLDADSATLERLLRDHRAHARAIDAALATPLPARLRSAGRKVNPREHLLTLERASLARLTRSADEASGDNAALLASIAASHSAHVVVLESGSGGAQ